MKKLTNFEKLLLTSNQEEQEKLLKAIVRAQPTNAVACIKLGDIYREKRLHSDAVRIHKNLLTEPGHSPEIKEEIYISIIKDYIKVKKAKAALPYVEELLKLDSRNYNILSFVYSFYEDFGYWKEAIELKHKLLHLKRAVDSRELAILHAFWGNSIIKGDTKEGLAQLKKALALDKLCAPALLFIGDYHYETDELSEGIAYWKQILDSFPDYAFLAFERLEKAYFEKQDFSSLEPLYISFLEQYPESVRVMLLLSEIHSKKGEYKEAIGILERAKTIDPKNLKVRAYLLKLYYNNNQYNEMVKEGTELAELEKYKEFKCYKCNKELLIFEFRCPHCKSWLTIR